LKKLSKNIAVAVALKADSEGIALIESENVEQLVESNIWKPRYVPYKGIGSNYPSK
jgi:malic enzyme